MGDGIIGLPGAEFDLSVLKVELDVMTVVELVTAGRTNIELEVLTPVPAPQPPVKISIKDKSPVVPFHEITSQYS